MMSLLSISLCSCNDFAPAHGTRSAYERANALSELTENKVYKTKVEPHWFANNSRFWYRNDLPGGRREFIVVDVEDGMRKPAFEHAKLAGVLGDALGREIQSDQLPFDNIEFLPDDNVVTFQIEGKVWRCELETYSLTQSEEAKCEQAEEKKEDKEEETDEEQREESPDAQWLAFFKDHNLCVREQKTGEEFSLSTDSFISIGKNHLEVIHRVGNHP